MKIGEVKIIKVAYRLFKQRGVRVTSLQHVAKAYGTSLFDINLIFKSKKDLVFSVVSYIIGKKTAFLLINSSLSPSAVSELNNFYKFVDESIAELGAEILTELRHYNPEALEELSELVGQKLAPYLRKIIDRGLNEGFYRNVDSEQYALTYVFILRTALQSGLHWNETKRTITQINDIFLHGVLNAKGMRI